MKSCEATYFIPPNKARVSYQPTILSSTGLLGRLTSEVTFFFIRTRSSWPTFKQDPIGFLRRTTFEQFRARTADHRTLATTISLFVVCIVFVVITDGNSRANYSALNNGNEPTVQMLALPPANEPAATDEGIGTGSLGRIGFDRGRGEGSLPEPKRSHGGGSGAIGIS